jgi:hypothetical protein
VSLIGLTTGAVYFSNANRILEENHLHQKSVAVGFGGYDATGELTELRFQLRLSWRDLEDSMKHKVIGDMHS